MPLRMPGAVFPFSLSPVHAPYLSPPQQRRSPPSDPGERQPSTFPPPSLPFEFHLAGAPAFRPRSSSTAMIDDAMHKVVAGRGDARRLKLLAELAEVEIILVVGDPASARRGLHLPSLRFPLVSSSYLVSWDQEKWYAMLQEFTSSLLWFLNLIRRPHTRCDQLGSATARFGILFPFPVVHIVINCP